MDIIKEKPTNNLLISFLQIYGIILVVIGHSFTYDNAPFLNKLIYSFHMPLFMAISGFLFLNSLSKKATSYFTFADFFKFFQKKISRLIVPYIVISTIVFIPKVLLSDYSIRPIDLTFSSYFEMLIYPGRNVIIFFWFLPTLFIISIFAYPIWFILLKKLNLGSWLLVLLILLFLSLKNPVENVQILNIGGVVHYFFYFLLGSFYYMYESKLKFLSNLNLITKFLIVAICHLILVFFVFKSDFYEKFKFLTSLLGFCSAIMLGIMYLSKRYSFLDHLFGSSYIIYLFSWFPQVVVHLLLNVYFEIPWYFSAVISTLFGIYFPYLIFKFLNRIKIGSTFGRRLSKLLGN